MIELVGGMPALHFGDESSLSERSELPGEEKYKGEETEKEGERERNDRHRSDVVTSGSPVANSTSGPQYSLFNTK
jgi:hypothetical protein